MFTLIKREIEDNISYFLGFFAASIFLAFLVITLAYGKDMSDEMRLLLLSFYFPLILLICIGLFSIGISMMQNDKRRKISAFLSTLPVSRNQILTARLITGILAILTLLAAPLITFQAMLNNLGLNQLAHKYILFEINLTIFLLCIGTFCTGLMLGFHPNKAYAVFGSIGLGIILATLLIIKGLGIEIQIILIVYIAACLVNVRHKFNTTALI